MKYISEERLEQRITEIEKISYGLEGNNYLLSINRAQRKVLAECVDECQELDTLEVNKLRPMSDIPIGETVLMKIKLMDSFYATVISEDDYLDGCDGWIPMPIYEPEQP